jgi:hypothetical protein
MLPRILLALSFATLSGCATNSHLAGSELNDKLRNNIIVVNPIDKPAQLTERTKGQAFAKFVVSTVVSSVASSGNINTKPGDFQGFQRAADVQMKFGQELNTTLNRHLPDNYKVASGTGTDLAIAKKLSDYYANLPRPDSALNPKELHVAVNTNLWELGYVSFLTSQNYALNYSFSASLIENVDGKDKVISSAICQGKSEKEMTLESWQANNYQNVNAEAETIAEQCQKKILAMLG